MIDRQKSNSSAFNDAIGCIDDNPPRSGAGEAAKSGVISTISANIAQGFAVRGRNRTPNRDGFVTFRPLKAKQPTRWSRAGRFSCSNMASRSLTD